MREGLKKESSALPILRQCFVTTSVALNIVGHGCVIGFSVILISALRSPDSHVHATPAEESWIASIIGFSLMVGNVISTLILDTLGRKKCHLLSIAPVLVGWFQLLLVNSVFGFIAARFLQGVAMGMLGPLGSIIIGEMTDPQYRGMFLTTMSLSVTIGVLFCHTLAMYVSWQICALVCSFTSFTSLLLIFYTPESPTWLISKGRYEEARDVFYWLRGRNEKNEAEIERMISVQKMLQSSAVISQDMSTKYKVKKFFRDCRESSSKPEFYKPILIMFILYVMFQFAGINVIGSYTADVIEQVVGPEADTKLLIVLLDVERLLCNILAVYLMKAMKRRTLLFSTGFLCVLSYSSIAGYVYMKQNDKLPFNIQWVPIGLLGVYMFTLNVGISSIPLTLSGEIFPLKYRSLGSGLSMLILSLSFFLAVKCYPVLILSVGLPLTYICYGSIVAVSLTIVWFMLPETKDRTLQEIEDMFRGYTPDDVKSAQPLNTSDSEMKRRSADI